VPDNQILGIALATGPTVLAVLLGILVNNSRLSDVNLRISELRSSIDARFNGVNERFNEVNRRFDDMDRKMDQRFEDMKSTWRSELHRVEEVLDARLKHLEER
jgi:DNA anti-recombination protein RmuC